MIIVRQFVCPKCGAQIGDPCRTKSHTGNYIGVPPHKERRALEQHMMDKTESADDPRRD